MSEQAVKREEEKLPSEYFTSDKEEEKDSDVSLAANFKYILAGLFFGIIFLKAEIISWFRMQEMFRFQSFYMYGVIGSAVVTGIISVALIKRFKARSLTGERIIIPPKKFNKGNIYGALIFGIGWAITGACPGPLYAQIGGGYSVIIITFLSAVAGTWFYGLFRNRLPH